jgi:thiol-disulfide isomerase/thioredoxin
VTSRIAVMALIGLAAAALGIYFYLSLTQTQTPTKAQIGGAVPFARAFAPKPLPDLSFQDSVGNERTIGDFRGRMVLLNIWATWCTPCREEMPALDRLQAQFGGPEFQVIAISVDQQGAEPVQKFFSEIGIKALERYIDPAAQAAFKLGAVGLPATLLVDRRGREIGRHVGPAKWDAPEIVAHLRGRIEEGRR